MALPGRTIAQGNPPASDHQVDQTELADWMEEIEEGVADAASLGTRIDAVETDLSDLQALGGAVSAPSAAGGPVVAATTGDVALTGAYTVDSRAMTDGEAYLAWRQATGATVTDPDTGATNSPENGIYVYNSAGAHVRRSDMDAAGEVQATSVYVTGGTTNGGKTFSTYSAVTALGTDPITFIVAQNQSGLAADVSAIESKLDDLRGVVQFGEASPAAGDTDGYNQVFFPFGGSTKGRRRLVSIVGTYHTSEAGNVYRATLDRDTNQYALTEMLGSFTPLAATHTTLAAEIDPAGIILEDGEILGIAQAKIRSTANVYTGAPWYQSGVADPGTTATGTAQLVDFNRLEIGYTVEQIPADSDRVLALETASDDHAASLDALSGSTEVSLSFGPSTPTTGAGLTLTQTYVFGPFPFGFKMSGVTAVGSASPGDVAIYAASVVGDQVTVDTGTRRFIDTVAGASQDYVFDAPLVIPPGGYIGLRPKNNIATITADGTPYQRTGAGDTANPGTLTTTGTNTELQIRFDGVHLMPVRFGAQRREITVANGESLLISSDSIAAGFHSPPGKAWPCTLGALTDYRIVNGSQPGRDVLGMADDIRNGELYWAFGVYLNEVNAKRILIISGANDGHMVSARAEYLTANFKRAGEAARAAGIEPTLISQVSATAQYRDLIRRAAEDLGCDYLDTGDIRRRAGGLPDWQNQLGHLTARSNSLYHQPVAEYVNSLPRPVQGIKAFRHRPTFAVSNDLDLLFSNFHERAERWVELYCSHRTLPPAVLEYYDALDEGADLQTGYVDILDEHETWRQGGALEFEDYALIEVTLPGTAYDLDDVRMNLNVPSGATVLLRDWDYDEGLEGKPNITTPDATYLAVWDSPVGRLADITSDISDGVEYPLSKIKGYVHDRKLTIIIKKAGVFTMTAPSFTVIGRLIEYPERVPQPNCRLSPTQLLAATEFDASLTGWSTTGTPASYAPVDQATAIWGPENIGTPVARVVEITEANKVAQAVSIPAVAVDRVFALDIYHRYNPLAYVDPTGRGWDVSRYIDRTVSTYPDDAPITSDTWDFRTLVIEIANGAAFPSEGGHLLRAGSPTMWHRTRYLHRVPAGEVGDFIFQLSAAAGTIEVAVCELREVV
ncbi:hypothetical protein [Sagittula sp. MA-2]|jgi:hypothetical protein|uniref:hypothetical protein n=1 Tax=Sagittula sp. MA-2 TaxID=3048007 RepID=UPI0024C45A44|nr:hypothetical protein [Sagittula sp. MA-2]WHZ35765.1 hypothetical protein QNI11_01880 [Sagittula sp. MA-2]